jgi:hypothetical protein
VLVSQYLSMLVLARGDVNYKARCHKTKAVNATGYINVGDRFKPPCLAAVCESGRPLTGILQVFSGLARELGGSGKSVTDSCGEASPW